jgi:hypothetical protein
LTVMRFLYGRTWSFQYYTDELCIRNGFVKTLVRHTSIERNCYNSVDSINIDSATVLYKMMEVSYICGPYPQHCFL